MVLMIRPVVTFRTRTFEVSAMYSVPAGLAARPVGKFSSAMAAAPPSPENQLSPLPATVVMIPLATRRTR